MGLVQGWYTQYTPIGGSIGTLSIYHDGALVKTVEVGIDESGSIDEIVKECQESIREKGVVDKVKNKTFLLSVQDKLENPRDV